MVSADHTVTGPTGVRGRRRRLVRAGRVGSLFNLWGREAVRARAAPRRRGDPPRHPALLRPRRHPRLPHRLPDPARRGRRLRPRASGRRPPASPPPRPPPPASTSPSPRCSTSPATRAGAGSPKAPARTPTSAPASPRPRCAASRATDLSGLAATPKHFAAYGASAAGRDYAAVDISDRTLAEIYLPPFRAAVDAGAAALMPAFTDLAGVPLDRPPRAPHRHPARATGASTASSSATTAPSASSSATASPPTSPEAAALALNAGVDIDMMSFAYESGLPEALDRGLVAEATIDAAVARVLALKERLGLLDDPYRRCAGPDRARRPRPRRRAATPPPARSSSCRTTAPCPCPPLPAASRSSARSPTRRARCSAPGPAPGAATRRSSVLAGLRAALPDAAHRPRRRRRHRGRRAPTASPRPSPRPRAADHVILCLGEAAWMSGEAASRARIDLPGHQAALAAAVLATGRPVIVLLFSGRPIVMPEVFAAAAAVVACWFPGSEAGHAVAALLTGADGPLGGPAGHLAARRRPGAHRLLGALRRAPGEPGRPLHQQVPRPAQLAAVPLRPRPHLHPLRPRPTRWSTHRPEGIAVETTRRQHRRRAPAPRRSSSSSATRSPASPARSSSSGGFARGRARRRREPDASASRSTARRLRLPRRRASARSSSRARSRSTSASPPTPPACARRASTSPDVRAGASRPHDAARP